MGKRSRGRKDEAAPAVAAEDGESPAAEEPQRSPLADGRLRDVMALAEEADYLYHLMRWTLLKGSVPSARDWLQREDMPHPDYVTEVFGSWAKFLEASGLQDSPLLARVRGMDERERELAAQQQQVEREQQRAADLRRQLDVARRKREDAERERDEDTRRATTVERALADAESRAARAEEALAERRAAAESTAAASAGREEASEEWLEAHEATLAELQAVRDHREELLRRIEELEDAARRDRQAIAELSAALGDRAPEAADGGPEAEEDPTSVLEAVRIAERTLPHLVFTSAAEESAADSPYRRPVEILDALRKLDALAERYAEGQMGTSLGQAAQELGLTWKAGVSELARTRFARHYIVTHDGHQLDLGPHVALGSGSGAGLIARIYLHVADGNGEVPRGIYVGHVGRHLPDSTT